MLRFMTLASARRNKRDDVIDLGWPAFTDYIRDRAAQVPILAVTEDDCRNKTDRWNEQKTTRLPGMTVPTEDGLRPNLAKRADKVGDLTYIALDVDRVSVDPTDAIRALPFAAVAWSTISHGIDGTHSYRVIVPLSRPLRLVEDRGLVVAAYRVAAEALGVDTDPSQDAAVRIQFLPGKRAAGPDVTVIEVEGGLLDVNALTAVSSPRRTVTESRQEVRVDTLLSPQHPAVVERLHEIGADLRLVGTIPGDGETEDSTGVPRGWEAIARDVVFELARLVASPETDFDEGDAEAWWLDNAIDVFADAPDCYAKIDTLSARVAAVTDPWRPPLDVLGEFDADPLAPVVLPDLSGAVFDPVGVWSDEGLVEALAARISSRARLDQSTGAWFTYRPESLRWEPVSGVSSLQFVRSMIMSVARSAPRGERPDLSVIDEGRKRRVSMDEYCATTGPSEEELRWVRVQKMADVVSRGRLAQGVLDMAGEAVSGLGFDASTCEPDGVFWAGGRAYDLRAAGATDAPVQAGGVSLAVPHLGGSVLVPDAGVATPRWDEFLRTVLPGEAERECLLDCLSVGVTGRSPAMFIVLWGGSGTGKTFTLNVVDRLLGSYSSVVPRELLNPGMSSQTFNTMKLRGLRFAFVDEGLSSHAAATEELLKSFTGGVPLTGAFKGKDAVTWSPTHTLAASTNNLPPVQDQAMLRRLRTFEFDADAAVVRLAVDDLGMSDAGGISDSWLAEEGPGILADLMVRAARGLVDASRWAQPDWMAFVLDGAHREASTVSAWLQDARVESSSMEWLRASEIAPRVTAWASARNLNSRHITPVSLGRELSRLGVQKRVRDGYSVYEVPAGVSF